MQVKEHLVVDALIVVDIQLAATEKVDVSYHGHRRGRSRARSRARPGRRTGQDEQGRQGGRGQQEDEQDNEGQDQPFAEATARSSVSVNGRGSDRRGWGRQGRGRRRCIP